MAKPDVPAQDNLKGLIQDVQMKLDQRMIELRQGTHLEDVRPADAKTFMLIARGTNTIGGLSDKLGISRQAAHQSMLRLVERGAIQLELMPGSARDKYAELTPEGQAARKDIQKHIKTIEKEIAQAIGKDNAETLRGWLKQIIQND